MAVSGSEGDGGRRQVVLGGWHESRGCGRGHGVVTRIHAPAQGETSLVGPGRGAGQGASSFSHPYSLMQPAAAGGIGAAAHNCSGERCRECVCSHGDPKAARLNTFSHVAAEVTSRNCDADVLDAAFESDVKPAPACDYAGAADNGTTMVKDGSASSEVAMEQCTGVYDRSTRGDHGRGRFGRCCFVVVRQYVGAGVSVCERGEDGGASVRRDDDTHNLVGNGCMGSHGGGGGGLRWSLRWGWRPSITAIRRSGGTTVHIQVRRHNCRHSGGGRVRHSMPAQRGFSFGARAAAIAQGCSRRERRSPTLVSKGRSGGSPSTSSSGASARAVWSMLQCDWCRCGVAAASSALRLGRPADGRDGGLRWEGIPPIG